MRSFTLFLTLFNLSISCIEVSCHQITTLYNSLVTRINLLTAASNPVLSLGFSLKSLPLPCSCSRTINGLSGCVLSKKAKSIFFRVSLSKYSGIISQFISNPIRMRYFPIKLVNSADVEICLFQSSAHRSSNVFLNMHFNLVLFRLACITEIPPTHSFFSPFFDSRIPSGTRMQCIYQGTPLFGQGHRST